MSTSDFVATVQGISFPNLKVFILEIQYQAYVVFVKGSAPKLEELDMYFSVSAAEDVGFYFGIEHLPCLDDLMTKTRHLRKSRLQLLR